MPTSFSMLIFADAISYCAISIAVAAANDRGALESDEAAMLPVAS